MVLVSGAIAASELSAHRRDEYLQAARLAIDPGSLELSLAMTPGIDVAERVIADIDRDRDGVFSLHEQEIYVAAVMGQVTLEHDGRTLQLESTRAGFPAADAIRAGEGTIQLQAVASLSSLSSGGHQLLFRNSHRSDISVYLANVLVPTDGRITITSQRHSQDQHELMVDYVVRRAGATRLQALMLITAAGAAVAVGWWRRKRKAQLG